MAEYLSPGVYVEEYDASPRSVEGVGTSTAGFVGLAQRGPTKGAPLLVTNFSSFKKQFGGFLSEFEYGEYRFLPNSVEQYFANGGTRCYVARVALEDAKKALKESGILKIEAANEGKWGNRIQVSVSTVKRKKMQITAKTETENTYIAKSTSGFKEGDIVAAGGEYNRIERIYDNQVTFANPFTADIVDAALVPKTVLYLVEADVTVRCDEETENYADVSFNIQAQNYITARMAKSALVTIAVEAVSKIGNPVGEIFGEGIEKGVIALEGGSDGNLDNITEEVFIGKDDGPGNRSGIHSFLENSTVSMMAVPGVTLSGVIVSLVGHCEKLKSRFAVLDMPKDMTKPEELLEYRSMIDSTYAAMYHPWIQVFDHAAGKAGYIPPSGAVLGVYAKTDQNRGVHKAPANETVMCTGLKTNYTKEEQEIVNPEGINLIRQLPGQGIRVWGARTAGSDSAFKYVNVRRLFIYVEESIKANTNWVVFEPNDVSLWTRVRITISSFLENLWKNGMLAGSTPDEGFFVEIGTSTMSEDDIRQGRLICNIGIAPVRPAEFVIFKVTQHTSSEASA